MFEALQFIFSSFWVWLGFTTLVAVVLNYLVDAIEAIRRGRKVKIYNFENGYHTVEIENASLADIEAIIEAKKLDTFEQKGELTND
jgi:hypothetical protein